MEKRNGYGSKGIKLSRKIRYFACVNGGSLAREESLLEGRPINAVVLDLFGAMKKRENQLNISSRSLPFLQAVCVCVCTQHSVVVNPRRPHQRFIERHNLAACQVTSRADEDPGIADSDGDVVVENDAGRDFDLVRM